MNAEPWLHLSGRFRHILSIIAAWLILFVLIYAINPPQMRRANAEPCCQRAAMAVSCFGHDRTAPGWSLWSYIFDYRAAAQVQDVAHSLFSLDLSDVYVNFFHSVDVSYRCVD
jgi:hypothetical protein